MAMEIEDEAGEIRGALGTVRAHSPSGSRSLKTRLLTLLAILGPGLIVMVGDNDAGGVSTYAQAGQDFGLTLLWVLPLLIPVLFVNQEMVVRLGAVTGIGHARLIAERFGARWARFAVSEIVVLNFLTIATEFIGVSLSLEYFGVSRYLSVPIAALTLIVITSTGSFQRWERFMFLFVFANFLIIPLAILSHPSASQFVHHALIPGVRGSWSSHSILLVIAIVGTTVAPWQLFFQQSTVVDKRITTRWINYERIDTGFGSLVTFVTASAMVAAVGVAFTLGHGLGHYSDALGVARGLASNVGHGAGAIFAIVLLNASIIGAASVTLATTYAVADVTGQKTSLNRGFREAKTFYGGFFALVVLAAALVLIPSAPLGLITTAVQALAGIVLPTTTVMLLLLCNDVEILGPWANRPWINALASVIVSILVALSAILMVTTVLPSLDALLAFKIAAVILVLSWIAGATWALVTRSERSRPAFAGDRYSWRMPPAALLDPPRISKARRVLLRAMVAYVLISVVLLVLRAAQLATGQ
jgi:NRAMP (natural resistance-associated macrophage protein)-like metal ion transporter